LLSSTGDVANAERAEDCHHGFFKSTENEGKISCSGSASIFIKGDIEAVMDFRFNNPVTAN
jgi:hypothetical protein